MALPILLLSPLFSVQLEEPQEHGRQLSHTFEVRKIGCATNTVEVNVLLSTIPLPIQCGFPCLSISQSKCYRFSSRYSGGILFGRAIRPVCTGALSIAFRSLISIIPCTTMRAHRATVRPVSAIAALQGTPLTSRTAMVRLLRIST